MKRIAAALILTPALALPSLAQEVETPDAEPPTTMERGLRLFLDGLMDEMEPALRDLEGLAEDATPFLEELQRNLGEVVEDIDVYEAPEILPNGDILIRRKEPLAPGDRAPEDVQPNPDGSIDL